MICYKAKFFESEFVISGVDCIVCVSMHNHNNEFILEIILRETNMDDFEHRQLEIQLEFVR